jgi:hypothetical protein
MKLSRTEPTSGVFLPARVVAATADTYYQEVTKLPGAIGFDRMATVVVACRGRSLAS